MSYTRERDEFIARITREGLPLWAAEKLLRNATTIQRLAELACSSEAADRDRIQCPRRSFERQHTPATREASPKLAERFPCLCDRPNDGHETIPRIRLQDWQAEQRCIKILAEVNGKISLSDDHAESLKAWSLVTQGDPRGYTLRIIPPSFAERNKGRDRFNLDAIGVPARPSNLRF